MDKIDEIINNTVYTNQNLTKVQKERITLVIKQISGLFNNYDVDVLLENSSALLSNIKEEQIKIPNYSDRAYIYDLESNSIKNNTRFVKDDSKRLYDYCNAILDVMSKKYNPETGKYNDGLIYETENGIVLGTKINNKLKHELLTIMTGEVIEEEDLKDFYVDKANDPCTLEDSLLMDMSSIFSTSELLTYFINADGDIFYSKISERLDNDEEQTINFFNNIDSYNRANSIEHRKKYDEYIKRIKENSLEMIDENSHKIA